MPALVQSPFTTMALFSMILVLLLSPNIAERSLETQHKIKKAEILASSPITSWQIDGGKVETVTDFIFLVFKITADSDYSHKIKRLLLLERKAMTNLESILKSRDTTLLTKVCIVEAMVFPVVLYGCESWIIKKTEGQRFDVSELW